MDFSDPVSVDIAGNGFDVDVRARLERHRSLATRTGIFVDELTAGHFVLRVVFGDRLGVGVVCVCVGATRAVEFVVVVVLAAVLLQAGDVLRDDQVSDDGDSWSGCWLGKTRKEGDGRGWAIVF